MACFTVPLAEAVVVSVVKHTVCKHADRDGEVSPLREKLGWLEKMLYGGSFLLAIEHIFHGEVTLQPPFLTAVKDGWASEKASEMLHELATAGVSMAVLVTAVWGVMWLISAKLKARKRAMVEEIGHV
ncbi:MAG: hypothetical protein J5985_07230 [Kiritimatiellae bacterium]|nr:hypothetical protein [Kiritimatiellia bacterium]